MKKVSKKINTRSKIKAYFSKKNEKLSAFNKKR